MIKTFTLVCPCHFGLEAVLKREITDLGYEVSRVEDGRVSFTGDAQAIALANLHLRTAERVLLEVGRFFAKTFQEYYEGIEAIDWASYIPKDGRFWVTKASTIKSALHSPRDLQSIGKKAMVASMAATYGISHFDETGASYPVRIFVNKDEFSVGLDTSGDPLHKRGYRTYMGAAPISETLASGIIMLSPFKEGRILMDPFCGSGTILTEAALMITNQAPGLNRRFTAQTWTNLVNRQIWKDAVSEAKDAIDLSKAAVLEGYDIDPEAIKIARLNAKNAGVDKMIKFGVRDVRDFKADGEYGFIITNPPYGERLEDIESARELYAALGKAYKALPSWSMFVISSHPDVENAVGRSADKNRKIYNGMIQTRLYQYMGEKPKKG